MREHAIESHRAMLIRIEPLVEEITQEAPVLRNPEPVDSLASDGRSRSPFDVRGEVADGGEPEACHDGIGRYVDILVELARLEPGIEVDITIAGNEPAVLGPGKLPLCTGHELTRSIARVTDGQHVPRIVGVGDGIFAPTHRADDQVAKRYLAHGLPRRQIAAN